MSKFEHHIIGGPQFYHESKVIDNDRRNAERQAVAFGLASLISGGFSSYTLLTADPSAESARAMTHQAIEAATHSNFRNAIILGAMATGYGLGAVYNVLRATRLEGALALGRLNEASTTTVASHNLNK